ncbi:TetR/AcrR family transcriptional regulator [Prescottella subtropica]|uniref:TetR/AcrR family transcriptional regulator n=1 Tax=Prescottella subtropica TaxID=2545757 RepID=UPI001883CD94|nr:TetR/AcrR family transcriptional regulator [Prescottella subtropica]
MNTQTKPTIRGRETLAAIENAARRVISHKGYLATTVADIAKESGRSTASFYNYYDSKEDLLSHWAQQFRVDARERALEAFAHGKTNRERIELWTRAHWLTYRERLAEMVGVFQLAMVNDTFAAFWQELCDDLVDAVSETVRRAQKEGYCPGIDPRLTGSAIVAMLNQFCYDQLANGVDPETVDDDDAIAAMSSIWYRAIYWKD